MAGLICSNWLGVELPGKKPDDRRANWESMTSRMRVAEMRSMSLLRQLLSVTGRWESRLDAVLSGLGRSSTAPRRQFRGTAPARRRLSNSQGTARLAIRPRWRSASPCIPSGPGARSQEQQPYGAAGLCHIYWVRSIAFVGIGWRRVGLWVPCCFRRLQLHEVADLQVSAEHWAIEIHGWRAQGTRGLSTGVLPAACCRPCPRARSGVCASGFRMLRAAPPCDGGPAADRLLRGVRRRWRGPIPPAMESRMGTAGDSMPGTVALVALRVPSTTRFSVLHILVNSRGILQSWLNTSLGLFQSAFFHANNFRLGPSTTVGVSSFPIGTSRRMMQ
ncbi:hypothetical protein C3747_888g19 [Trypanosoma cruzi]|uniref:Uncharacterized protein n=1 Tax=Trypanosoma cruzi TaxID=5693 RepID=A0A2V2UJR9_TRYCR|nr:hypothetical protein C3747_888g19 [Trypanosoma cruzi]